MPALCGCSLRNLPGGTQGMRKGPTAWPDHMTHRYRPLVRGPVVHADYCDRQGCDVTRERLAPAATGTLDRRPYWRSRRAGGATRRPGSRRSATWRSRRAAWSAPGSSRGTARRAPVSRPDGIWTSLSRASLRAGYHARRLTLRRAVGRFTAWTSHTQPHAPSSSRLARSWPPAPTGARTGWPATATPTQRATAPRHAARFTGTAPRSRAGTAPSAWSRWPMPAGR